MGKKQLFIDEIHRFNKGQQDAFLPLVENGTITLIGATTENPSFELNPALLSRATVFILNRLDHTALNHVLEKAESIRTTLPLTKEAREMMMDLADGDGRYLLNMAEQIYGAQLDTQIDKDVLADLLQKRASIYDKSSEAHYNLISALHKSVRGSDPDAALYWFARMLEGGEDPKYLARRITRMAVEDIGLASPQALPLCVAAWETYERLGSPEGELALAEALVFLASAPKSNAVYTAYNNARKLARDHGSHSPPKHILNAPTSLMKEQGYGNGYQYDHDVEGGFSGQNYFPDTMQRHELYTPKGQGFEKGIKERLDEWSNIRKNK
jgi:putative ATPase